MLVWCGGRGVGSLLDGDGIPSGGSEIVEQLRNALFTICIGAEGVDNPDLAEVDCCCEGGRLGVPGDELHVLDAATLYRS